MTSPFGSKTQVVVQPQATAGSDTNTNVLACPHDGVVSAVTYTTVTAITGADTQTRKTVLVNKGAAGSGTTVIATLQYNSGVNTTASVPKTITLSGTAADLAVAAGDVLQWQSTHVGTGIADPGGLVNITIAADYA